MKTYPYPRGRRSAKKLNGWGETFEALLLEKRLTVDDALRLLVLQHDFVKLNRSTLYRWGTTSDTKVPPRAHTAIEVLKQKPAINASDETINQWVEKLTRIVEQFDAVRTEIRIIIAQLSFHKTK